MTPIKCQAACSAPPGLIACPGWWVGGCLVPGASAPWRPRLGLYWALSLGRAPSGLWTAFTLIAALPAQTVSGDCQVLWVLWVPSWVGRVGLELDLTSLVLDGPGPAAGQTTQKLNQALCRKGSCSFKALQEHTSSSLALQLGIFSSSPKYLLVGACEKPLQNSVT